MICWLLRAQFDSSSWQLDETLMPERTFCFGSQLLVKKETRIREPPVGEIRYGLLVKLHISSNSNKFRNYEQTIDYHVSWHQACPAAPSATRTHMRKLPTLSLTCCAFSSRLPHHHTPRTPTARTSIAEVAPTPRTVSTALRSVVCCVSACVSHETHTIAVRGEAHGVPVCLQRHVSAGAAADGAGMGKFSASTLAVGTHSWSVVHEPQTNQIVNAIKDDRMIQVTCYKIVFMMMYYRLSTHRVSPSTPFASGTNVPFVVMPSSPASPAPR